MTHDDDAERVKEMIFAAYLDMDASDLAKRMNAGMSAREALQLSLNGIIPEVISAYRHVALSALPPRDELLREALTALEPFAAQTRASGPTEEQNIRRARAAADKIRAALTQEDKT